ncbi:MAG TPA: hypothetical protein VN820_01810 [Acidimicrobiales bacterium]|nr:hypothetical protein [Acidimicrobiales bacterium]
MAEDRLGQVARAAANALALFVIGVQVYRLASYYSDGASDLWVREHLWRPVERWRAAQRAEAETRQAAAEVVFEAINVVEGAQP